MQGIGSVKRLKETAGKNESLLRQTCVALGFEVGSFKAYDPSHEGRIGPMKFRYQVSEVVDQVKKGVKDHPEFSLTFLEADKKTDSVYVIVSRQEGKIKLEFLLAWRAIMGLVD